MCVHILLLNKLHDLVFVLNLNIINSVLLGVQLIILFLNLFNLIQYFIRNIVGEDVIVLIDNCHVLDISECKVWRNDFWNVLSLTDQVEVRGKEFNTLSVDLKVWMFKFVEHIDRFEELHFGCIKVNTVFVVIIGS